MKWVVMQIYNTEFTILNLVTAKEFLQSFQLVFA